MVRLLESNREQNLKFNFELLTVLYIIIWEICGGKICCCWPWIGKKDKLSVVFLVTLIISHTNANHICHCRQCYLANCVQVWIFFTLNSNNFYGNVCIFWQIFLRIVYQQLFKYIKNKIKKVQLIISVSNENKRVSMCP